MNSKLSIESVEVFEWYDGVVLGLVRSNNLPFLVCLLAFDPDAKRRLYLLASVPSEEAVGIQKIFKQKGPEAFNKKMLSRILGESLELYLTEVEPQMGKMIGIMPATDEQRAQLPILAFPLIDGATTAYATSKWLTD